MESFDQYLKLTEELKTAEVNLRFGKKSVPVWKLANQYYCEKQVELIELHGEEMTQVKKWGKEGHEADLPLLQPVKPEKIWWEATRQNRRKPCEVREFHVLAKHREVFIEGRADEVSFLRGVALKVTDFKFREVGRVYRNDIVQAGIYGYLLNQMSFDTIKLTLEIVCFPPGDREFAIMGYRMWRDDPERFPEFEPTTRRSYPFDLKRAEEKLDWALRFLARRKRGKANEGGREM